MEPTVTARPPLSVRPVNFEEELAIKRLDIYYAIARGDATGAYDRLGLLHADLQTYQEDAELDAAWNGVELSAVGETVIPTLQEVKRLYSVLTRFMGQRGLLVRSVSEGVFPSEPIQGA